jgi:hypothetical protein
MTTLTCPKCRQGLADDALDVGQCPLCGFPLDGPVVLGTPGTRGGTRLLLAVGLLTVLMGAGVAGYAILGRTDANAKAELANRENSAEAGEPATPVTPIAPLPHEPKPGEPGNTGQNGNPPPADPPGTSDKGQPVGQVPPGMGDKGRPPVAVEVPKKDAPRPVAVVMKVDPKIESRRHFDHPHDTAALPDLNTGDRVILTGKVRVLRIGSVNGKGFLDASGLVAEEVIVTGDLNSEAQVLVNAPNGKVTVGGFVLGNVKVTVIAPGGLVVFASTGRLTGGSTVTVTAKRLELNGPASGGTKVNVTLLAGGSLKVVKAEEGATITYKKAAANDAEPVIEKGELRGGAKIIPTK